MVNSRPSRTALFFSSRRRHTRWPRDWSSDVCSSDLPGGDRGVEVVVDPDERVEERERPEADQREPVAVDGIPRSEERRVGKECRSRWGLYHDKKKIGREE